MGRSHSGVKVFSLTLTSEGRPLRACPTSASRRQGLAFLLPRPLARTLSAPTPGALLEGRPLGKARGGPIPRGRGRLEMRPRFRVLGHPRGQHTCDHRERRPQMPPAPGRSCREPRAPASARHTGRLTGVCPRSQQPATQRRDGGQPNASPPDFPGRSGVPLHSLARPSPATPNVPERPRECQLCMEQPWASGFPPSPLVGLNHAQRRALPTTHRRWPCTLTAETRPPRIASSL